MALAGSDRVLMLSFSASRCSWGTEKSGGVSSIIFNQGAKAKLTDSTIWVSVCRVGHDL